MLHFVMIPIGDLVYLKRLERGMTQSELAEKSGIPRSNLSNIEKGKRDMTISTLRRIAAALDVSPRDFFEAEKLSQTSSFSRAQLEHIAKIVSGKAEPDQPEEIKVANLFKKVIPKRGRKYVNELNRSWLELRKRFSPSEIAAIYERSDEHRRRQL